MNPAKTAEPIEMPSGMMSRVDPRNHVLDAGSRFPCEGAIFRGKDMSGHTRQQSVVRCAKTAEAIEMPFGLWTRVGPMRY